MAVTTPCYCNRVDAQRAVDFADPDWITTAQTDRAIQDSARNIEGHLHRLFYPWDGTKWWDWPNTQYASPWKLWLDRNDVLCLTNFASGTINIPLNTCFLRPANPRPGFPYTSIELDRSSNSTFGGSAATPQNNIMVQATWGFTADADQVTTAAASIGSGDTVITIADGSQCSAGDVLILGYARGTPPYPDDTLGHAGLIAPYLGERILVTDTGWADSGVPFDGPATASAGDNLLAVPSGAAFGNGEVLLLDAEQMLITGISQNTLILKRAWNGTVLSEHTGGEIYAQRSLTVQRGALGTAGQQQAWSEGTAVWKHRVPSLIRDLNIAEALNRMLQETSGYSRTVGAGDSAMPASGVALADLWDEARTEYGRMVRSRVV